MNFDRFNSEPESARSMAEASIVKMIMLGSGGPENHEMTEQGLRFIRHLMSTSRACKSGFLPNFKDVECAKKLAREFIRQSGDALLALRQMHQVI